MIQNYFKIAWRNLKKHGFYSGINIFGLFTGLTFSLLIASYVWGELSVNKNLKNAEHQVLLKSEWKEANIGLDFTSLAPLAKRLKEDYPSLVNNYFRWDGVTSNVSNGDKRFRENLIIGDSTFLSMFGFKLIHGNKNNVLKSPNSILITAENAIKYFGKTDAVGETLRIQNFSGGESDFLIEGVLKNLSENSITQINSTDKNGFILSSKALTYFDRDDFGNWNNIYIPSYIELKKGVTLDELKVPISMLIAQNASENIKQNLTVKPVYLSDFYLQKDNGLVKRMIYSLSFVGLFILIMAVINFVNISISTAGSRMKEIGVRKVMGSSRQQLIFQFLVEALIMVLSATILALIAYSMLSPAFGELVGAQISPLFSFPLSVFLILGALVLFISFIAGLYPAFVLSALKPTDSIKGKLKTKSENIFIRKALVGFQFSMALIVLISATIITQQLDFFFGQNLGYNKEFILSAQVPRDWSDEGVQKLKTIRNEFATLPQISDVSLSYEIPNGNFGLQRLVYRVGNEASKAISMKSLSIDEKFLKTYQIKMISGATFTDANSPDSTGILINEKAAQALGWENPEEAIGQHLIVGDDQIKFTIKGVTDNFHFSSMHTQIQPIIMLDVNVNRIYRYLSFRVSPTNIQGSIEGLESKWASLLPGTPFEYKFMDETLSQLYNSEIQLKKATYNASLLSLIIVLLGVVGLVSLNIHHRIKEIGIRKVLGASVPKIIILFLKEFLSIIIVAGSIAFPLAYFIMQDWLNSYVYNIKISIYPFIYALLGLSAIVIILIGLLTWKAAMANPVKSLRTE